MINLWGSPGWRAAAEEWAHVQLAELNIQALGPMTDLSVQPWSAVWSIPTNSGGVLLKQVIPAKADEGAVHAFCAATAPDFVDPPLAIDRLIGRILFADGGSTMSDGSAYDPGAIAEMISDYARLQQATSGHRQVALTTGLPLWDPLHVEEALRQQCTILRAMPTSDPRHITAPQHDQLLASLGTFRGSGAVVADSPIPHCLEHGDLWPGNVLVPRQARGHYRFIDFGDAAWTHPFLSVMPLLFECHRRWAATSSSPFDLNHPALTQITDAYLQHWVDYASVPELRETLRHASRLAPLRRSWAAITNMSRATAADAQELGPSPWTWLKTAISTSDP